MSDLFDTIAALRRNRESFAVATVVARRPPVSGHLGDQAIVYADGRMEGFVGGACSREIVRRQAVAAMRARHACLVSIRPDVSQADTSDPEHVVVPMTCVSEGAVDVYVEPFVRARRLVVVGSTPVADALARTGRSLEYDVVRVVTRDELRDLEGNAGFAGVTAVPLESLEAALKEGDDVAAVVASQGHYDEEALETILKADVSYVGLVSSRKRGETVRAYLEERGVPRLDRLHNPAGLDLGARTAPEVALSILAEIVKLGPSRALTPREAHGSGRATDIEPVAGAGESREVEPARAGLRAAEAAVPEGSLEALPHIAIDPVCQMEVVIATARHTAEVDGRTYYFCCPHCRARFLKDPASYLEAQA